MRRLLRWAYVACLVLSLLLFVATTTAWVRSYWVEDQLSANSTHVEVNLATSRGDLWLFCMRIEPNDDGWPPSSLSRSTAPELRRYGDIVTADWGSLAVNWHVGSYGYVGYAESGSRQRELVVPLGAVWLLTLVIPLRRLFLWRRGRRRKAAGLCAFCGYDLRASPQRCPECGRAANTDRPVQPSLDRVTAIMILAGVAAALALYLVLIPSRSVPDEPWINAGDVKVYCGWQAAVGNAPDRMYYCDSWGNYVYRTVWRHGSEEFLVLLQKIGHGGGLDEYSVCVLDRKMNLIRRGTIIAPPLGAGVMPYCLAEVRSDDLDLPEPMRNKWTLAIGCVPAGGFDASRPITLEVPHDSGRGPNFAELHVNGVQFEPVWWGDLPQEGGWEFEKATWQIRVAEEGLPPVKVPATGKSE